MSDEEKPEYEAYIICEMPALTDAFAKLEATAKLHGFARNSRERQPRGVVMYVATSDGSIPVQSLLFSFGALVRSVYDMGLEIGAARVVQVLLDAKRRPSYAYPIGGLEEEPRFESMKSLVLFYLGVNEEKQRRIAEYFGVKWDDKAPIRENARNVLEHVASNLKVDDLRALLEQFS